MFNKKFDVSKYKIGIFGSAVDENQKAVKKARILGKILARYNLTIITGACSGIPYQVASEAAKNGTSILGYSPELNIEGQKRFTPKDDLKIYKKIYFVPKTFEFYNDSLVCKKYRNVISTANCDAGIIISGRWGTMNEFTNLYDMGKVIGVLTRTGGIADELIKLNKKITKKSKATIFFDSCPKTLIDNIIKELNSRNKNK